MSYAIVRNEKLTRAQAQGICVHNDRKAKNHTNKEIDISKSHLNYYLKRNELNYVKEFDKLKEKYDLKGQIRSNSIIACEMVFTSDSEFFNKIKEKETKRYFEECYKFICNYNNLGERNIMSAVVHLDEGVPHMHLVYVPVIHTKDKDGNDIEKICARDFWKGRDSYRKLQNKYWEYVTSKGFELQRGLPVEETNREHISIQEYKKITNFENTKKVLEDINLELPEVPQIKDFKKLMMNRDEKIAEKIIKPKDELIEKLHQDNVILHKELTKQAKVVDIAEEYQQEKADLLQENKQLKDRCNTLQRDFEIRERELRREFKNQEYENSQEYVKYIDYLENENNKLHKVIDRFKLTISKFITWICNKFSVSSEDTIIRDFEKENYISFNVEKQMNTKEKERDIEPEL